MLFCCMSTSSPSCLLCSQLFVVYYLPWGKFYRWSGAFICYSVFRVTLLLPISPNFLIQLAWMLVVVVLTVWVHFAGSAIAVTRSLPDLRTILLNREWECNARRQSTGGAIRWVIFTHNCHVFNRPCNTNFFSRDLD